MVNENSSVEAGKIPSPSSIPEEKLKKVLAFIMTATQVNSNLRNEQAFEWFINTFCESSIINKCSPEENQVSDGNFFHCPVHFCNKFDIFIAHGMILSVIWNK